EVDLALVDDRLFVDECELNRVLDGEDMQIFALVDVVEHAGDGRALARASDAGEDDQPLVIVAELLDRGRQVQALEGGDLGVDATSDEREPAALLEQVDAEAALLLANDVGVVDTAGGVERLPLRGSERRVEKAFH